MRTTAIPLALCLIMALFGSYPSSGQGVSATAGPPTRTNCALWDDAYLSLTKASVIASLAASFVLPLVFGFAGRRWWVAAAPRGRIAATGIGTFAAASLAVVGLPQLFGFEWGWVSAIGLKYWECETLRFGAIGFFDGLIGADLAAISQWPTILGLQVAATVVGGLASWGATSLIARLFGLRRLVRGEAA